MTYHLSPQARWDLEAIGDDIAEDSLANAERFIARLTSKLEALSRNPMIGRARPELRPGLRSFPYGAYIILYRATDDARRSCASCMPRAISTTSSEGVEPWPAEPSPRPILPCNFPRLC